ncbi:right-handed parallel beta-helix repeat-containing protein [Dictyobacter kobayashii]|uniref:right-handed parallel beta-helix repeat-containing protein n=1 Tax=Dictyobacter kobayashii TaxID=2014872 RepID=UPI00138745CC|nr:right-handed parallel beta-helix repeat-containing protein [Dictyobacter kobayashii]
MYTHPLSNRDDTLALRIVSLSSQNPAFYPSISAALQASISGDTILVEPGTYRESLVIDKAVSLVGNGGSTKVVIESIDLPCLSLQANAIRVEGFTLRNHLAVQPNQYGVVDVSSGQVEIVDCDLSSASYACLVVSGSSAAANLRHCHIHDSDGYGVLVCMVGSCKLEQCTIQGNAQAEVAALQNSDLSLQDCTLCHGRGYGVLIDGCSQGRLLRCDIYDNAQPGVAVYQESVADLLACKLHHGRASGVTFCQQARGLVQDCEAYANIGSAIEVKQQSTPTIRSCKIYKGKWSGIFVGDASQGIIEDCEIFDNVMAGIEVAWESNPIIRHCQIHRHSYQGIAVFQGGRGIVADCDLSQNVLGSISVEPGSLVYQERNSG